ncbi:MAG TPA: cupredoxin domain-containing protein [Anaeromyxobacter sp.]|nr:cupredoxin domain-containing protein [Anaeromyxobacter sp.]
MISSRLLALAALLALAPTSRAADKAPRTVEMALTADGLAPSVVKVTKGETVRLAITRKTDKTCMNEVVVQELGVKQALPLGKTVNVDVTPSKSGSLRILCGMGMEFGKIVVN